MTIISRETLIGDLVNGHPELIDTLLSFGVHCLGCDANMYESLEDGFRSHGMSEEEIDSAVQKLNIAAAPAPASPSTPSTITITADAWAKIKELCEKKQKAAIRISVHPGGCSGFKYAFDFADAPQQDDTVFEQNGSKLFVNKSSMERIAGSTIDYEDSLQGAGFRIKNPNVKASCGCGNSFR